MPPRRRVPIEVGRAAVAAWLRTTAPGATEPAADRPTIATAVRYTLEELAARAPGRSTEVRVPPHGAVQCVAGLTHRRGTPPNVVETDADTWLAVATGRLTWDAAWDAGRLRVSGTRADLTAYLPLASPDDGDPAP